MDCCGANLGAQALATHRTKIIGRYYDRGFTMHHAMEELCGRQLHNGAVAVRVQVSPPCLVSVNFDEFAIVIFVCLLELFRAGLLRYWLQADCMYGMAQLSRRPIASDERVGGNIQFCRPYSIVQYLELDEAPLQRSFQTRNRRAAGFIPNPAPGRRHKIDHAFVHEELSWMQLIDLN